MKISYWHKRLSQITADGKSVIELIDQMHEYYENQIASLEGIVKVIPKSRPKSK